MKKVRFLGVLTSIALLGGCAVSVTNLASCGQSKVATVTISYSYNADEVSVEEVKDAEAGSVISIKITAKTGYIIEKVNNIDVNSDAYTLSYTVKESGNTITITSKAKTSETAPFTLTVSYLILNVDTQSEGVALSDYVSWGSNTPEALDVEIGDDSSSLIKYENGKLIPLKVGTGSIKIVLASDSTKGVSLSFRITQNATELESFNTYGGFTDKDATLDYFDTTGSNRLSDTDGMKFGVDNDARGEQCINLWVENNITDETKLPKLVFKKTVGGVKENTDYTLSYKLRLGLYTATFKINGVVVNEGTEYDSTWTTYYHVFNTGSSTSIEFEVVIEYTGEIYESGVTPWGHFGSLRIGEGDERPVEEIETNYIRNGSFTYGATAWEVIGDETGAISYDKGMVYNSWKGKQNEYEVSLTQEFEVSTTGTYNFAFTISAGTDDYKGENFSQFFIEFSDEAGNTLFMSDAEDYKGSDLSKEGAIVEELSLSEGAIYSVVIVIQDNAEKEGAYGVVSNLGVTLKDAEDKNVTIDGYEEVKQNESITLVSNRPATWSVAEDSTDVTLTPSEDGTYCEVTGVNVGSVEVIATSKEDAAYTASHYVEVLEGSSEEETYVINEDFSSDVLSAEGTKWTKTENSEASLWVWVGEEDANSVLKICAGNGASFTSGASASASLAISVSETGTYSLGAYLNAWSGDGNSIMATLVVTDSNSTNLIDKIYGGIWDGTHAQNVSADLSLTAGETYYLVVAGEAWEDGTAGCAMIDNLTLKLKA